MKEPLAPASEPERLTGRWWRSLFAGSETAQLVCRADGIAEQINPRARRLLRLKPEADATGFNILAAVGSPAHDTLRAAIERVPARPAVLSAVAITLNGVPDSVVDVETAPLEGGYTLLILKDAGRRVRIEAHVQRLVTAMDATPDVFFIVDHNLRLTFVNPAFQSATGYNIEEVLGRTDEFLRVSTDQGKVASYRDQVRHGKEWIGELVNQRRDGTIYQVESTVSSISDMAGGFLGYVVSERDITVRKQLEDQLRIERDFVGSILHSLDGAIYSLDRNFHLTHANEGWKQLPAAHGGFHFEHPPEIGHSLLDYVSDPARKESLRTAFGNVLESGAAQEDRYHAPDGRHWLVRISPWIDGRSVRGLICSVADQTHYHDLQDQLFQAQKMEIIGALAAGVAHDFNNLLQAIRGNTGLLLLDAEPGSDLRRGLDQIDIAAVRAADITSQLLCFSRQSSEKRIVLDLNQVIQEAAQLARRTLRGNIAIELQPAAEVLPVEIDSTRANQALLNLCVNAQDAMPEGGRLILANALVPITAEIAAQHGLKPDEILARCSVTDTGTGIAPEVLQRIFKPFFTTKAKGKGTGLGLPIVHRVVQEAGGYIEVESVLGHGTTFHLYLPLVREELTPIARTVETRLTKVSGRVLVVDDMDLVRDFTQSFLLAAGLEVLAAGSGPEAIQLLENAVEPVDLLFTDYNMPGMNGAELIEQVAARWPHIKFLLASGLLDDKTRARVERCKGRILAKPYEMSGANDLVLRLLAEN